MRLAFDLGDAPCSGCGAVGTFTARSRATVRQNSRVQRATCTVCTNDVFVKQCLVPHSADVDTAQAVREFESLTRLHQTFATSEAFATLTPVAHLPASGVVITKFFDGAPVIELVRDGDAATRETVLRNCARWLRVLHDSFQDGICDLDVQNKYEVVSTRWSSLSRSRSGVRRALSVLEACISTLAKATFARVRLHGDFKLENLLFDGSRMVGLDCGLRHRAAGIYDLAPFLDHLVLAFRYSPRRLRSGEIDSLETRFLEGYLDGRIPDPVHTVGLHWLRLYFMLSYWHSHLERHRVLRPFYDAYFSAPTMVLADRLHEALDDHRGSATCEA